MKAATGTAEVRKAPLRNWLTKHNARRIAEGKLGKSDLDEYLVNGHIVVVIHEPDGAGWDLLIPASTENSITATLRAAETACDVNCSEAVYLNRVERASE